MSAIEFARQPKAEYEPSRPTWSAIMLARDPRTCRSLLEGRRVRAGNLDGFVLRRALRGERLPDPETYLLVTHEMLDAINEAGPLPEPKGKQWR